MTKAAVTCVVSAHREGQLIHATLQSVNRARLHAQKQGIKTDLIVTLDKSDKLTTEVVTNQLRDSDRSFTVAFGDPAQSRNFAISQVRTEFTTFLDGDDLWCKSWLAECCHFMRSQAHSCILHPTYNVYFGGETEYIMLHADMEHEMFSREYLLFMNYWTALSFARTSTYEQTPYQNNQLHLGFGYEDWTWNYETVERQFLHKVVPNTAHFIRQKKHYTSRSGQALETKAIPRILDIYLSDVNKMGRTASKTGNNTHPESSACFRVENRHLVKAPAWAEKPVTIESVSINGAQIPLLSSGCQKTNNPLAPAQAIKIALPPLKRIQTYQIDVSFKSPESTSHSESLFYCPLAELYREKLKAIFFPEFYAIKYLKVIPRLKHEIFEHFLHEGLYREHSPNPWFDAAFYRENYPQRLTNISIPLLSFLHFEDRGNLKPSRHVNLPHYRSISREASIQNFEHYVNIGGPRGWRSGLEIIPDGIATEIESVASFEPDLRGYHINTKKIVQHPVIDRLTHTSAFLRRKHGNSIRCIVCIQSESDLLQQASKLIRALHMTEGSRQMLVINTSRDVLKHDFSNEIPHDIDVISLCEDWRYRPTIRRLARYLHVIIGSLSPRTIINIESDAMWEVTRQYGKQLCQVSKLVCFVHSLALTEDQSGDTTSRIRNLITVIHGIVSDNPTLADQAEQLLGLSQNCIRKITYCEDLSDVRFLQK